MGGLARGRVRSETEKRDPEKEIRPAPTAEPGSKSNTGAGEMIRRAFLSFLEYLIYVI